MQKNKTHLIGCVLAACVASVASLAHGHGGTEHLFAGPESPSAATGVTTLNGVVIDLVVDDTVLAARARYVGLRLADGRSVRLKGDSLAALASGARVQATGKLEGTTLFMTGVRQVASLVAPPVVPTAAVSLEGRLTLMHADNMDSGVSEYRFAVIGDDARATEVVFPVLPDILEDGMRIRVGGNLGAGSAALEVSDVTILALPPGPKAAGKLDGAAKTVTTNNVIAILVKFTNSPATDPFTQAQAQAAVFGGPGSGSVAEFYKEASYGQQLLAGTATNWVTAAMAGPATCDFNGIGAAADTAAAAAGYNLASYINRVYIFPHLSVCGWSGLAYVGYPRAYINGTLSLLVIGHELGHNFGALHAASLDCGVVSVGGTCTSSEYGDEWVIMGNRRAMHFNATQKAFFGWIPPSSVKTQTSGTQSYTLAPFENAGGATYAVKVPGRSFRTYWLEYRQPIGFDSALSAYPNNGVQLRVAVPFETICGGCADDTELVDMTPTTSALTDGALLTGQRYHDNVAGLTVTVGAVNAAGATVTVRVDPHAPKPDFDQSGSMDIVTRNASTGATTLQLMNGSTTLSSTSLTTDPNWTALATGDFDGDGRSDLVWWNATTGQTSIWLMNGASSTASATLSAGQGWKVVGVGDFNGDGRSDLVWRNLSTGQTAIWLMNGTAVLSAATIIADPNWTVTQIGDVNDDGRDDLVWRNTATGQTALWLMDGLVAKSSALYAVGAAWQVVALGDFNGDHKADLVWENAAAGETVIWLMRDTTVLSSAFLPAASGWHVTRTADLNGDGKSDLVWRNSTTGATAAWLMNGVSSTSASVLLTSPQWSVIMADDLDGDGKADLVWSNSATGAVALWQMNGLATASSATLSLNPSVLFQRLALP